jgi:3-hydroxyacyl-CoA dehydrogenase
MSEIVSWSREGAIALITIDNPPVNALGNAVRTGLLEAVWQAAGDAAVRAIVILCAGRTFIAGADVTEFGKPRQPPTLAGLCDAIEAVRKPVIAVLHGTALGGGFEIALACHYRIAARAAAVGLPEINLGLIPGAGGTNRLARLIGPEAALKIALSGDRVSAPDALALGAIDELSEGELRADAIAYARGLLAEGKGPRPTRADDSRFAAARDDLAAFDAMAAGLIRRRAGQDAPVACVASMRRALTMGFDVAIAADRDAFAELSAGPQSKALRHVFFAERAAAKLSGDAVPRPVRSVAILGAGTMGGGIAMSFVGAGVPVTLIDTSAEAVEKGLDRIRSNYAGSVKRGSLDQADADRRFARIAPAQDRSAAATADLVIEAVFEDMALKQEIFAHLDRLCRPDAVLASNTSALDVDAIAKAMTRPERFVGMHFFSPANVMKLCEVVDAAATDAETLATTVAAAKAIAKVPVVAGNCDGFIGNRMVAKRSAQAEKLLQEGALPAEVDAAIRAFGFAAGPLQTNDMSGLDIGYAIRKRRGTKFHVADAIVESGRLGQKTGAGYYRYEPGSREPIADAMTTAIIEDVSCALGVARRAIGRDEMTERMVFALVNEGAKIVAEGIARRPSDVDVVWVYGYGFPRWRGGPLFYADTIGLGRVVERLKAFADVSGDPDLVPAPLLVELANSGRTFADYQKQAN